MGSTKEISAFNHNTTVEEVLRFGYERERWPVKFAEPAEEAVFL